jgi:hypothetical protein
MRSRRSLEQIEAERQTIALIEQARREHKLALDRLLSTRKALVSRRVRRGAKGVKTAFQRAGKANVEKARDFLRHNGPTPKAQVTRALGINDGTVTYALRALEERGEARKTGERVHGSDVYEFVQPRRAVTRPGDRR